MDDYLIYDSYTGTRFRLSKERMELLRKEIKDMNNNLKVYCIKVALKKPFCEKLYEMKGMSL